MGDMRGTGSGGTSQSNAALTMDDEMNLDGMVTAAAFDDTMDMVGVGLTKT